MQKRMAFLQDSARGGRAPSAQGERSRSSVKVLGESGRSHLYIWVIMSDRNQENWQSEHQTSADAIGIEPRYLQKRK